MATLETQKLDEIIVSSRRKMLSLGGAALASMAFSSIAKAQTTTLTDADYLNFALNLEYLEAQYYTLAVSGQTIDQQGVSIVGGVSGATGGSVTVKSGGPTACKVPFANPLVASYALETAQEERNHVTFLSSALAGAAVAQPNLDLVNSFNYLASLLGLGLTAFDPFGGDIQFLIGSYIFEDVGVSAYTGAAPLLTTPAYLDAAAGIQGVEAYHAGLTRTTIWGLDQSPTALGPAGTARAVCSAISNLRATADGSKSITAANPDGNDIGLAGQMVALESSSTNLQASSIVNATTTGSLNPAIGSTGTANSMVSARSAAEVLLIVYAGGTTTSNKGFYPNGLNGNVK
jgi:hypothetical protein